MLTLVLAVLSSVQLSGAGRLMGGLWYAEI